MPGFDQFNVCRFGGSHRGPPTLGKAVVCHSAEWINAARNCSTSDGTTNSELSADVTDSRLTLRRPAPNSPGWARPTERRWFRRGIQFGMHSSFPVDAGILFGAALVIVGVVVSGVAERYRLPGLVLFLVLGMVVADDGLGLVHFADARLAQNIAIVALVVILFEGGLATAPEAVRRAGPPAAVLATVGVVITAAVAAGGAALAFDLPASSSLLIGAVVASTDAAAVFSALRGQTMPARVRDLLQLESGLNDPVAVMLTIGMVEVWRGHPGAGDWLTFGLLHLVGGAGQSAWLSGWEHVWGCGGCSYRVHRHIQCWHWPLPACHTVSRPNLALPGSSPSTSQDWCSDENDGS